MRNIVGIGSAGCAIADAFSVYPQYKTFKIDAEPQIPTAKNFLKIKKQKSMEEYEKRAPSMKRFFRSIKGEVLVIVGGTGKVSGVTLRVLETLQNCKTSVLYIRPDLSLVADTKTKQDRVAFYVLQEFARSDMIDRMYMVANTSLEAILGDVPIVGYYDKLNHLLVSTIHMINVFENSDSVIDTHPEDIMEVAKLSTFGLVDKENEEKWFYPIDFPREKAYYYAINKKKLTEDGQLHKKLVSQIKGFTTKHEKVKVSYGIYETDYEHDLIYCKAHLSKVQD